MRSGYICWNNGLLWMRRTMKQLVFIDLAVLMSLWCLSIVVVNPTGEFPLNDDWSFARTAWRLVREGKFQPLGWAEMSLLTQTLWGAMFCRLFGCSFTVLRFSTLLLSLLCIFGVYLVAREVKCSRWLAILGALTLAFNPIYFSLSYTFMTDVPFLAFLVFAVLFFVRNLRTNSRLDLWLAVNFTVVAVLCREVALCLPLAYGLIVLGRDGLVSKSAKRGVLGAGLAFMVLIILCQAQAAASRTIAALLCQEAAFLCVTMGAGLFLAWACPWRSVLQASVPVIITSAVLFGYQQWLHATGRTPSEYGTRMHQFLSTLLNTPEFLVSYYAVRHGAHTGVVALLYVGLSVLPVSILFPRCCQGQKRMVVVAVSAAAIIVATGILVQLDLLRVVLPLNYSILHPRGLGPLLLAGGLDPKWSHWPALPHAFWSMLTLLATLSGALLVSWFVAVIVRRVSGSAVALRERQGIVVGFLLTASMIYCIPIAYLPFYDRYFLPVVLLLLGALLAIRGSEDLPPHRMGVAGAVAVLVALLCFSVTGTHDYLAWNRARWEALDSLMTKEHVDPSRIDGGFEFNGLYCYDSRVPVFFSPTKRSWWWVQDDTYMIAFEQRPGYHEMCSHAFSRWLPPGRGHVLTLRRCAAAEAENAADTP